MRKSVVFILSCLLFIPALANAWTLVVTNTNANSGNYATISWPSAVAPVKVAVNNSPSILVTAEEDATVTYTVASGSASAQASVDGATPTSTQANNSTVIVQKGSAAVHTVATVFDATSTYNYSMGITPPTNGIVVINVGGASTTMGYTSVQGGTNYTVTASPYAGYSVTSITINGTPTTFNNGVGVKATSAVTTLGSNVVVSAVFALTPIMASSSMSLPVAGLDTNSFSAFAMAQSIPAGSFTYVWTVNDPSFAPVATGTNSSISYKPLTTGDYNVSVDITPAGGTAVHQSGVIHITSGVTDLNGTCTGCHSNSTPAIIAAYNLNSHPVNNVALVGVACTVCHSKAAHSPGATCVGCHSMNQNVAGAGLVNDNSGVRSITQEFGKWSHHVTGVTLNDAHCAACHLEGTVVDGKIVVDDTKHMSDATIHLRDTTTGTDADFAWDPTAPNHSGMDNFCMSCHNANGAVSPMSVQIQAFINDNHLAAAGKTASATNPFGDTISNQYDQLERPAVVDAKGQFNTGNNSHHAVIGQKYTGRSRVSNGGTVVDATFAVNSSATMPGKRSTIFDAGKFTTLYTTLANTVAEVSPRNGGSTVGDDSTLHCGDCHTVGQWTAGSAKIADGTATTAVIGAHGSNNEYLLRNNIGTDEKHIGVQSAGTVVSGVGTKPYLICFNCHVITTYNNLVTGHAGEHPTDVKCNGPYNTITNNATGDARLTSQVTLTTGTIGAPSGTDTNSNVFGIQCNNCHNSGVSAGNIFGGIHGSKDPTYTDGMGNTTNHRRFMPGLGNTMFVPGTTGGFTGGTVAVYKAYSSNRLTGVNLLYTQLPVRNTPYVTGQKAGSYSYTTGGVSSDLNWEQSKQQSIAGQTDPVAGAMGCYTLGVPGTNKVSFLQSAGYPADDLRKAATDGQTGPDGRVLFDNWGGCEDHNGAQGKGTGPTRGALRPVSY
jgi:hypothetical protein